MNREMDRPNSAGWWWCIPDPQCEWHAKYSDGVFVEVEEFPGFGNETERFYVSLTGTHDVVGLTREHSEDLFGKWYGPICPPSVGSRTEQDPNVNSCIEAIKDFDQCE